MNPLFSLLITLAHFLQLAYTKTCLRGTTQHQRGSVPMHGKCFIAAFLTLQIYYTVIKTRLLITRCPLVGVSLQDMFTVHFWVLSLWLSTFSTSCNFRQPFLRFYHFSLVFNTFDNVLKLFTTFSPYMRPLLSTFNPCCPPLTTHFVSFSTFSPLLNHFWEHLAIFSNPFRCLSQIVSAIIRRSQLCNESL